MEIRSRPGVAFGAKMKQGSALVERSRPKGFWGMRCRAPLNVSDPDKARWVIRRGLADQLVRGVEADITFPRALGEGIITAKEADALFRALRNPERSELERLLSGGGLKWSEEWENLVVNAGLDHLLDVTLSAATQITTWYILLIDGASPTIAAGDTMSSHAGWTENQNYSEAARQTWTDGGVSSQSVDNSGSVATFTIDTNSQTIGGAGLTSDNTKGGTTGTLYAAGTFSSSKSADANDTLDVTATFTQADDGA